MERSLSASELSDETRDYLDRRIDSLGMSTRATKACEFAGIESLGELALAKQGALERMPNCGPKTVAELEKKLSQFGLSLGMCIAGWQPSRRRSKLAIGTKLLAPENSARITVSRHAACLEEELQNFVGLIEQGRNLEIVSKIWGFGGNGCRTLESVGLEYQVSRERVRQIAERVKRLLSKNNVDTPWLARAIKTLAELTPSTPQDLALQLRKRGVTRSDFDVDALSQACKLAGRRFPFAKRQYGAVTLVVAIAEESKIVAFSQAAQRLTMSKGCVNFEAVCDELGIDEPNRPRIKRCVALINCVWLDHEQRWFMSSLTTRNRLVNLASKVFWVTPKVSVAELRKAVAKERRLASAPPTAVMARFLEVVGLADVEGGIAILKPHINVSGAVTSGGVEETLVDVLRKEGPVLGWDKFQALSIARGVNPFSFAIYTAKSPMISRLARGVFAPVGEPVQPGIVEQVAAEVIAARKPAEWGWLPAGTLWCAIQLNTTVITSGRTSIPSFVCEYTEGQWSTNLDGCVSREGLKCGNGFLWGFRRTLVNFGAEAGDVLVIEFNAQTRTATLYISDDELTEAFEEGKPPQIENI